MSRLILPIKSVNTLHFRNTRGNINAYRETYHDNGEIDMAEVMKIYKKYGIDVPIRVDHVPTMAGEDMKNQGYDAIGRYFAIGYLKGILDAVAFYSLANI